VPVEVIRDTRRQMVNIRIIEEAAYIPSHCVYELGQKSRLLPQQVAAFTEILRCRLLYSKTYTTSREILSV
jgi:hypothetical protein